MRWRFPVPTQRGALPEAGLLDDSAMAVDAAGSDGSDAGVAAMALAIALGVGGGGPPFLSQPFKPISAKAASQR